MKYFILDLESKPQASLVAIKESLIKPAGNLKDPDKIAANLEAKKEGLRKDMAVDPDYAEIVCVGIKEVGVDNARVYTLEEMVGWFKEHIIHMEFDDNNIPIVQFTFITFNGKNFDIPLLIRAGIKKDLDLPYRLLQAMTKRYNAKNHIDLMELLSGTAPFRSLDEYLQIYLGIQKETKGEEFFSTATDEDLKKHCIEDLAFTEQLFTKFNKLI